MSMQGKVVVITGTNTGVGLETAVGVAAQGATTVLAYRNQDKAEAAAHEVTRRTWNDDVHMVSLDLADLASVRKAADEILTRWDRSTSSTTTPAGPGRAPGDGPGPGVHHGRLPIAHFYLTRLLLDRLQASAPSRVINVTSVGHHAAFKGMRFDDLQSEKGYEGMEVYCRAKLANVLFTRDWRGARRAPGSPPTRPTPDGCAAASAWTATPPARAPSGSGPCGHSRSAHAGCQDVGLPRHLTRCGDANGRVLGPLQARSYGEAGPQGRAAARDCGTPASRSSPPPASRALISAVRRPGSSSATPRWPSRTPASRR